MQYRESKDALLAVLGALDKIDAATEGVSAIRIWRYAPKAGSKGGKWGWSVSVVREINDNNTAPPGAYNWTGPARRSQSDQDRDRLHWRMLALEAREEADKKEAEREVPG